MSCPYAHDLDEERSDQVRKHGDDKKLSYRGYLQLSKLLDCQKPISTEHRGHAVHDELFFIIIHQVYELWFKEIIHELDSVMDIFEKLDKDGKEMFVLRSRLVRILKIQKVLRYHLEILETMTALDFMKFRDYLAPASGFQSLQFRLIEIKFGIGKVQRSTYNAQEYREQFDSVDKESLKHSEEQPSLLGRVQRWLERTPGLEKDGFHFSEKYKQSVQDMLNDMRAKAETEENEEEKAKLLKEVKKQEDHFDSIISEKKHNDHVKQGSRRFSHKAMQGALMISFYREEPQFSQSFQILQLLMDIDSLLLKWRFDHSMMVQRMIGSKVGTGGTSGYQYLRSTVSDRYKVFVDLFNLSNFFLPCERIPPLSSSIKEKLDAALEEDRLNNNDTSVCCYDGVNGEVD